jgi:hypothetical protein
MLKRIKKAAMIALAARKGRLVSAATGLLTVGATSAVASLGFSATPAVAVGIAGAAGFLASWAVDTVFLTIQGDNVEEIQRLLAEVDPRVQTDRWAGKVTVAAVKDLVKEAKKD